MVPAAGQSAQSGNPFRRKTAMSQASEHDISNPSSPVPASPFANAGLEPGLRTASAIGSEPSDDFYTTSQPVLPRPPFTTFRSSGFDSDTRGSGDDSLQARPKKIVKKVRVQSPPPSSPEDIVPVTRSDSHKYSYNDDEIDDAPSDDSTDNGRRTGAIIDSNAAYAGVTERTSRAVPSGGPPTNPFTRTLQDIEGGTTGDDGSAAAAGGTKGAMDVDSFKRLLLTGNVDPHVAQKGVDVATAPSPATSATPAHDVASSTDASSVLRQSVHDPIQDMPWKSHDIAESDRDRPLSIIPTSRLSAAARGGYSRPKPPPPSSRHGKLIKVELGADDRGENPQARPIRNSQVSPEPHPADSDVNKPLPLPPARTVEDDATESPFDREAAGKAPETCAEPHISQSLSTTTTRARSESQGSTQSRRSVVPPQAPPPRRHARSESKVAGSQPKSNEEDPPRSSLDSTRSRSESIRAGLTSGSSASAPAPPPPRRPNHGRSNSSYSIVNQLGAVVPPTVSPSSQRLGSPPTSGRPSLDGSTTAIPVESSRESTPRIAAPPPPPARNSSVRRPPSSQKSSDVGSISGATRKSTRDSLIAPPPPPPPPPRQRGSSRGSMEGHNRPTPKDLAAQTRGDTSLSKGAAVVATSPSSTTDIPGAGILADLDALQREVDALMKQAKTG